MKTDIAAEAKIILSLSQAARTGLEYIKHGVALSDEMTMILGSIDRNLCNINQSAVKIELAEDGA